MAEPHNSKRPHEKQAEVCVIVRDAATPPVGIVTVIYTDEACDEWFAARDPEYREHSHYKRVLR